MPPADAGTPLADEELEGLFSALSDAHDIAVAVSGGSDSLALLDAIDRWRRRAGRRTVVVLTVDHGLRYGSAQDAAMVATIAASRGLEARVLAWSGAHPTTGIEAAARAARYRLLIAAAAAAGATRLVTAHHRDDQAETFLMRLARGAGVFGLAAMRPEVDAGPLTLVRPFLGVSRQRLAATTLAAGWAPAVDPMNADRKFMRTRVRGLMPGLSGIGLDAAALAAMAGRMGEAAAAIDRAATELLAAAITTDDLAVTRLDRATFVGAASDVRLRALARILIAIGGEAYAPRHERLVALDGAMSAGDGRFKRTLGGVVIEGGRGAFALYRELGRAGLPSLSLAPGFAGQWDHRFRVTVAAGAGTGLTVDGLGEEGRRLVGDAPQGVPAAAIRVLPAIRRQGRLVAVPALGWGGEDEVWLTPILAERLRQPQFFPDFLAPG